MNRGAGSRSGHQASRKQADTGHDWRGVEIAAPTGFDRMAEDWAQAEAAARAGFAIAAESLGITQPPSREAVEAAELLEYRLARQPDAKRRGETLLALRWIYRRKASVRCLGNGQVALRWRGVDEIASDRLC